MVTPPTIDRYKYLVIMKAMIEIEKRIWKKIEVAEGELMSITEAAKVLDISLSSVGSLRARGLLRKLRDTSEPNPTYAGRVLRSEVFVLKARRNKKK